MAGSLPRTLTALELHDFSRCPPRADLQFVLQLHELRSLRLWFVFAPLSPEDVRMLKPPTQSSLLPYLTRFAHVCSPNAKAQTD